MENINSESIDKNKIIDDLKVRIKDYDAELLRCRTHETYSAHLLDSKLTSDERWNFKLMADDIASLEYRLKEAKEEISILKSRHDTLK